MSDELEFVALLDPHPLRGEAIELRIANPGYAEEMVRFRAVLERNPFAESFTSESRYPTFSDRADDLIGADEVAVACTQLALVVGYPFSGRYAVTIHTSSRHGFTRAELFRNLVRVYSTMYAGATYAPARLKLQTRVESPRFGTAWHRLEELAIEHVMIQMFEGVTRAWISIGS